jgi:hypothetical protein
MAIIWKGEKMSKVITFSRFFPKYHPKAGQPTYFVEKLLSSINYKYYDEDRQFNPRLSVDGFEPKHHTIRKGNRWKVGDKFSPRVWSGKPYNSKQIIICPDIEIKQVFNFTKDLISDKWYVNGVEMSSAERIDLAQNDGLLYKDLLDWFQKPFNGQIICWSDAVSYGFR